MMDRNKGCHRPSSAAFKDPKLSVDAEPILHSQGLDWTFSVLSYPAHSLVRFTAKAARELQLPVIPDPLPDNKSHTLVRGKKTQGTAKKARGLIKLGSLPAAIEISHAEQKILLKAGFQLQRVLVSREP